MSKPIVLGRQQRFFEIPADAALVVVWVAIAFSEGLSVGLRYGWVLAIGLVHGTWVLRMRLQLRGRRLELPLVGPWRRAVDLDSLESIRWRHTGGPASKGTMLVRDRTGRRVPIYVGRFTGSEVWSKILLEAAERSGAMIDDHSRHLLSTATTASD
jgi:hypothetical protein